MQNQRHFGGAALNGLYQQYRKKDLPLVFAYQIFIKALLCVRDCTTIAVHKSDEDW